MTVHPSQLAAELVRREARRREGEARRAEELRQAVRAWASEHLGRGDFGNAWLIGSLAWGTHGAGSDVDIVVEGLSGEPGALWAELVRRLDCEVDLVRLEELPADFAARVLTEGLRLP